LGEGQKDRAFLLSLVELFSLLWKKLDPALQIKLRLDFFNEPLLR
jgi:hypothetical protein